MILLYYLNIIIIHKGGEEGMRKLNLNVEVEEKELSEGMAKIDYVISCLLSAVNRAINKPDSKGMATNMSGMDVQRRIARIMRILDGHKEGIVELEDSDFDFIYRKFHQAEFPVGREITPMLEKLENKLDEAKNGKSEEKKK